MSLEHICAFRFPHMLYLGAQNMTLSFKKSRVKIILAARKYYLACTVRDLRTEGHKT